MDIIKKTINLTLFSDSCESLQQTVQPSNVDISKLESAPPVQMNWPENVVKPMVGLVKNEQAAGKNASWPKYERFLKTNNIPYKEYDISRSDFIEKSKQFDLIAWRVETSYSKQWEAIDKTDLLEKYLGKTLLQSSESLWLDEDKVRLDYFYKIHDLPHIKTFISQSRDEVMDFIETCDYPIISKDKVCSCGKGVYMIKNKLQAYDFCEEVFTTGLETNESYVKQKDYVYFQEFVPNHGFDLRIIMVGEYFFGYFRYPKVGDYKASGSGIVDKKALPIDAMLLAKQVRGVLPASNALAVDFIKDSRDDKYYIVETTVFVGVETTEQLMVDGVAGRYREENGEFTFEPGRFWIQELMLEDMMNDWIKKHS